MPRTTLLTHLLKCAISHLKQARLFLRARLRLCLASCLLMGTLLILVLPALGFLIGTYTAPSLENIPSIEASRALSMQSPRTSVGSLWHLHVTGSAWQRGFTNGFHNADLIERTEQELFTTLKTLVPSFIARHIILSAVAFNNRHLEDALQDDEQLEIAGIAAGYRAAGDPHTAVSPAYNRILHYHALHDASQYLIDNPLIVTPRIGCTTIAINGARSEQQHLLIGRIFDFEGGRSFDLDKLIITHQPDDDQLAYCSVSWGGVSGVVTGINEAKIWISLNAAVSDTLAFNGRPIILAAHAALAQARTLQEAVDIIRASDVFVSESILLASGSENRALVLEIGPTHHATRDMTDNHTIVTNHFLAPQWQDDSANASRMRNGTTLVRAQRAQQLIMNRPQHNPASVLQILRDRRGLNDSDIGFGNRSAINGWIGAHLVVADMTTGVLWVCEPHHGLGRAHAFDVYGPRSDIPSLPASPDLELFLSNGAAWKHALKRCENALDTQDYTLAQQHARHAISLNPQHYQAYALLASALTLPSDRPEKITLLEHALTLQPAYKSDVQHIEQELTQLRGGMYQE